jgi:murein DD-endopeptidase MepM/ murein hydrolase activator NlpD
VALSVLGGTTASAQIPGLPPGVTLPPRASDTTTTTAGPPVTLPNPGTTTSTTPPTTAAPAAPPSSTPAAETKIILLPPPAKIVDPSNPGSVGSTTTVATGPGATSSAANDAPSLSAGQVEEVLRSQQRSGASSTSALVEALKPLQNVGMTLPEALALGMGRFPVLGVANWTDDWLDPRAGPPPHQHQGNDLFAAFDTPVRAPVDGVVRFEDAGLGGKGAFVTAPDGTYYYMAHLNGFAKDLANGAAVKQGQVVGYNGDSGNAKGGAPHVHFEIHPRGGAAVDPKPILDAWVADALARVPDLLASYQPKVADSAAGATDGGVPQILVATGLTRRFSTPSLPPPGRERTAYDFNHAVLAPLTPNVLAPMFDRAVTDK